MYEKPVMRGLHIRLAKRKLFEAIALSFVSGALFIQYYIKPRQRMLTDYYKDYDPEVSINYMNSQGRMRSYVKKDDDD